MPVHSQTPPADRCSWCGTRVDAGDGFRAAEHPGDRAAVFCRLEHVVPWAMRGAHWGVGERAEGGGHGADCAQCGGELHDVVIALTRHRGEHRITDAFCSVDHMADWAKTGGRWR